MASKMAQFFQQLVNDADALQRFQHSAESREALLIEAGLDAGERAMIQAADSDAMHAKMLTDHGVDFVSWANNTNNNNNIGKFKRPAAGAR